MNVGPLELVLLVVLLAALAATIAGRKGRNRFSFFLLGLLFPGLGFVAALLVRAREDDRPCSAA